MDHVLERPRDNESMGSDRKYHHGSLRETALKCARALVEARGHSSITMRDLAERIGVAPSALYRHYSSRSALLVALAEEAHVVLGRDIEASIADSEDPREVLYIAGRRFFAFTRSHPALFRMMYDNEVINAPEAEGNLQALKRNYVTLLGVFREAYPELTAREARLRLIGFWATLFGYATVRLQGALKSYMTLNISENSIEEAVLVTACGTPA